MFSFAKSFNIFLEALNLHFARYAANIYLFLFVYV